MSEDAEREARFDPEKDTMTGWTVKRVQAEAYRRGARDVLEALHRLALTKVSVPHYRSRWRDAWAILSKSVERGIWPQQEEGE